MSSTTIGKRIHCSGKQILDSNNNVIQLNGVAKMGFEYANPVTTKYREVDPAFYQQDVNLIASWKVNCVRIPFNANWYNTDAGYRQYIRQFVDLCAAKGIYVIMDMHWWINGQFPESGTTQANADALANAAVQIHKKVATDYLDQPYMIGVEMNEFWPLDDRNANWIWVISTVNRLAQQVHAINPNLLVFADVAFSDLIPDSTIAQGVPLVTEPNIVLAPHFYVDPVTYHPWFNGKYGANDGWDFWRSYGAGDATTGKTKMYTYLNNYMLPLSKLYNVPVMITEFATQGTPPACVQACTDAMNYFKTQGWGVCYWAFFGGAAIGLQLLLSDWISLAPNGQAFVSALYGTTPTNVGATSAFFRAYAAAWWNWTNSYLDQWDKTCQNGSTPTETAACPW